MTSYYIPIVLLVDVSNLTSQEIVDLKVAKAEEISNLIYQLTIPPSTGIVTRSRWWCGWLYDPGYTRTDVYLEVPESDTIPIHLSANAEYVIREMLNPFKDIGAVTEQQIIELINLINISKGQRVAPYDFLPLFWKQQAMTLEGLRAIGWFPEE